MKPVLLVVIDALASRIIVPAMRDGKLPTLARLAKLGQLREECISIFPSVTPAATSSILTGDYPIDHGVAGAYFYDREKDSVRYFGIDIWPILRNGFSAYFNEFGCKLNEEMLKSKTLFFEAAEHGLSTGSINFMIYNGPVEHKVDAPWLFKLWPGVKFEEHVHGPDLLLAGSFISTLPHEVADHVSDDGLFQRFGFRDETTAAVLLDVARSNSWPDFTVAYFPDNDFDSHDYGPAKALATVEKVDQWLAEAIELGGGFEKFLEQRAVLVLGDHSQCDLISDEDDRAIDLDQVLTSLQVAKSGAAWADRDQLMVCPNMRAAQIYLRQDTDVELDKIVELLISDRRVDQVIWHERQRHERPTIFHIATADRGKLRFELATAGATETGGEVAVDEFGNRWNIVGDLNAVDATSQDGKLIFRSYPNALERVANSFNLETNGEFWVTALPGYEFVLPEINAHDHGSHGSLHALDSLTPLIGAGLPAHVDLPDPVRTVDVVSICRKILGINA